MNQNAQSDLEKRWDEIVYDLIDYPSVQFIYKDFDKNFIQEILSEMI